MVQIEKKWIFMEVMAKIRGVYCKYMQMAI
jgi:hypothetical protein